MPENALEWITYILVVVGAVNWGLVGLGNWDLVAMIFGSIAWLAKIVYILVGLSGLYVAYLVFKQ